MVATIARVLPPWGERDGANASPVGLNRRTTMVYLVRLWGCFCVGLMLGELKLQLIGRNSREEMWGNLGIAMIEMWGGTPW
jgi:hypothetical protein